MNADRLKGKRREGRDSRGKERRGTRTPEGGDIRSD